MTGRKTPSIWQSFPTESNKMTSKTMTKAALITTTAISTFIVTPAMAAPAVHDMTVTGMFLGADMVVKSVMVGLVLASIATWAVLFAKSAEIKRAVKAHQEALGKLEDASSLNDAIALMPKDAIVTNALLNASNAEIRKSADALHDGDGLKERVASRLERLEAAAGRNMTRGTGILASIGSTAPFVGLFGTVWGIMNSFIGIAAKQTTNLAVVAPGIAEALLATAFGLVAAIPAVVIYNFFTRKITGYKALIGDNAAAVLRIVSRDLSRNQIGNTKIKPVTAQAVNQAVNQASNIHIVE